MANNNRSTQENTCAVDGVTTFVSNALLPYPPRGVHCNSDVTYKVTYANGSRAIMAWSAGVDYDHSIVGVSTRNGSRVALVGASLANPLIPLY